MVVEPNDVDNLLEETAKEFCGTPTGTQAKAGKHTSNECSLWEKVSDDIKHLANREGQAGAIQVFVRHACRARNTGGR